jgi:hypothetical protein
VTVEAADAGGHIVVRFEEGIRAGLEYPAFLESAARDDYAVDGAAAREPVTFHETNAGMGLRHDFDRFTRTSDGG